MPGGVSQYFARIAVIQMPGRCGQRQSTEGLMRLLLVAVLVALLAIPANAQRMRGKQQSGAAQQQTAEQKKKAEEAEKAYKSALDNIPVKKPADPWAKVR
jgi:hypothetical protein